MIRLRGRLLRPYPRTTHPWAQPRSRRRWAAVFASALGCSLLLAAPSIALAQPAARTAPPAAAPISPPAPAPAPLYASAPDWLKQKLAAAVDDAFSGVFTAAAIHVQGPSTIVLEGVVLEPKRPFGWAELAEVPPGGPPRRFDGRLTIERATLELAAPPSERLPLAVIRLTLERPVLIGAQAAVADAQAMGPRVEAGVDRNRDAALASPSTVGRAADPLRRSFEHINVAIHTLPPTVSIPRLARFLPLESFVIRGGQIVSPGSPAAADASASAVASGACGIDLNAQGDPSGQWRFGLSLTAPAADGWTQVRTQGTASPDMGAIHMTNLKFLSVDAKGETTELDVGRVRLRLAIERGPANGDQPLPAVDTTAIDNLPPIHRAAPR